MTDDKPNDHHGAQLDARGMPVTLRGPRLAERLVGLLAGRWTFAVLGELGNGGRRYHDLLDSIEGVSAKVLTDTLRRAERDGLIVRHLDAERIETATLYELTDVGRSLHEPLGAFEYWAEENWAQIGGTPRMGSRGRATLISLPPHTKK